MGGKVTKPKTDKMNYKVQKMNMLKADMSYLFVGALVLAGVFLGWRYYESSSAPARPAAQIPRPAAL